VADWEDLVTASLIGTDRRAVPDELPPTWGTGLDQALDPAHTVLSLAARHRAADRAGGRLPSCPPSPAPPPNPEPVAGLVAHEILVRLLSPPQVDFLNLWLTAAAKYRQCVSAAYWTPLMLLAARTTELDRTALARVLGERGMWFAEQNPQWTRLAKGLRSQAKDELSPEQEVSSVEATEDAVRADPELILGIPQPWPDQLTRAVLNIIASGQLQQRGPRYAAAVGARLPPHHYAVLRSTVQQIARRELPLVPAGVRSVREAVLTLERTVWLRIEMQSAFSGEPIRIQRLEIPQW
jgi:hypothetical protein